MSKSVAYWAEEAFGVPYTKPDLGPMRKQFIRSLTQTGAYAVGAAIAVSLAAATILAQSTDQVELVMLDPLPPAAQKSVVRPDPQGASASGRAANKAVANAPAAPAPSAVASAPTKPAQSPLQGASPVASRPVTSVAPPAVVKPAVAPPSRPAPLVQSPPKAAPTPQPVADKTRAPYQPPVVIPTILDKANNPEPPIPQVVIVPAPPARPPADPRTVDPRALAAKKPVDIAPAEKLAIQDIRADGIRLVNGTKVAVGSRLPNGEVILAVDVQKNMVETDRRIMMVTP